jgi:hypothetical protein
MLSVILHYSAEFFCEFSSSDVCHSAEQHSAESHSAEYLSIEFCYAECPSVACIIKLLRSSFDNRK